MTNAVSAVVSAALACTFAPSPSTSTWAPAGRVVRSEIVVTETPKALSASPVAVEPLGSSTAAANGAVVPRTPTERGYTVSGASYS